MRLIDADEVVKHFASDGMIREIIDSMPTVDSWITCSERLPNNEDMVAVTCNWGSDTNSLSVDRFYPNEHKWLNNHVKDVIAWMPFPEPYESEGE